MMKRSYESEYMDGPVSDRAVLVDDLRNLRAMNRFLGGSRGLLYGLKRLLHEENLTSFSLLDVGTGSADIPTAIARWSRHRCVTPRIVALDAHAITVKIAAQQTNDFPEIAVVQSDGATLPFRASSFDVVTASQFLHHFTEAKIVTLLQRWATLARKAIVISDLIRHPAAYYGIYAVTRLCTRNRMTIHDAALSVKRALTLQEWKRILNHAAVGRVQICSIAPYRMSATILVKPS
jgi:2-polyprenyl-3-methyl-5-hydroxy-6-metoxy-1,4-benzoquinol methylase